MKVLINQVGANAQYWIVCLAVLMVFAVPRAISPLYEVFIELLLFGSLTLLTYVLYTKKVIWIFLYFFILLIFYNPYFLIAMDIETSPITDVAVAISFFIIALNWEHILHIHLIQSK